MFTPCATLFFFRLGMFCKFVNNQAHEFYNRFSAYIASKMQPILFNQSATKGMNQSYIDLWRNIKKADDSEVSQVTDKELSIMV